MMTAVEGVAEAARRSDILGDETFYALAALRSMHRNCTVIGAKKYVRRDEFFQGIFGKWPARPPKQGGRGGRPKTGRTTLA